MSNLNYIRQYYQMPWLKCGLPVNFDGKPGRVIGAKGAHVRVKLDEKPENGRQVITCHPTWHMAYYDKEGKVLASYQDQEVAS